MWQSAELRPTVTEYRVGTCAFHDRSTIAAGTPSTTSRLTRCTPPSSAIPGEGSRDSRRRVESAHLRPGPDAGFGLVLEAPHSTVVRLSEEHAWVELADGDELQLGQLVRIVPNHACVVVNLFDELQVARNGSWNDLARRRPRPLAVNVSRCWFPISSRWPAGTSSSDGSSAFSVSPLGARNAAAVIVVATALVVVGGGVLIELLDHEEYPNIGIGMW